MYSLDWSPDGSQLAFGGASDDGSPPTIKIVSANEVFGKPIICSSLIPASDVAALIIAINNANATPETDDICLEGGTYTFTTHNNNTHGRNALPVITSEIRIVGNEAILQRDENAGPFRLLEVASTGNLILQNLTLQKGYVNGNANDGGAILVDGGILTTKSVSFLNNQSNDDGGAVYNAGGTVTLNNTVLDSNQANAWGGALTLHRVTISHNTAVDHGGGIEIHDGTLSIFRGSITHNTATDLGGGIYAYNSEIMINNATLSENSAKVAGAIYATDGGRLEIINHSLIELNTANWDAGAIYASDIFELHNSSVNQNTAQNLGGALKLEGTSTISYSSFSENSARQGGAIRNEGNLTITESTFILNAASFNGGAIDNENNASLSIMDTDFFSNSAQNWGGAIYNEGILNLTDTNFSLNQAEDGGALFNNSNTNHNVGYNCFALDNIALEEGNSLYSLQPFNAQFNFWGDYLGALPNAVNALVDASDMLTRCPNY